MDNSCLIRDNSCLLFLCEISNVLCLAVGVLCLGSVDGHTVIDVGTRTELLDEADAAAHAAALVGAEGLPEMP